MGEKLKKKVLIPAVVCIILLVVSIGGNLWLWTSLNQANSEITSLETTVYTKSSEIDSLGLEKEALESQVTDLQADKNNLQSQVSSLETDKSQLESQVSSLQTDKSSLETQVSSLETENNQLQTWLDGNITNYESQLTDKNAQILDLEDKNDELRLQYNTLNTTYTWLKQHSFTYYTVGDDTSILVGDDISISNVGIYEVGGPIGWIISGTITNIGDKPIGTIYVYRVLRNPDGTADFSTYDYVEVLHVFVGETSLFVFPSIAYDGSQTVEIFLVY